MGRRPETLVEKMAKLAASLGVEVPEELSHLEQERREADATVLYLIEPEKFRQIQCKQCSRLFAANYGSVAMCSDKCRREWLRNIGIEWNLSKTQSERWAGRIPLVVPPDAFLLAKQIAPVPQ